MSPVESAKQEEWPMGKSTVHQLSGKVEKIFPGPGKHFMKVKVQRGVLREGDPLDCRGEGYSGRLVANRLEIEQKRVKAVGPGKSCIVKIDPGAMLPPIHAEVTLAAAH